MTHENWQKTPKYKFENVCIYASFEFTKNKTEEGPIKLATLGQNLDYESFELLQAGITALIYARDFEIEKKFKEFIDKVNIIMIII